MTVRGQHWRIAGAAGVLVITATLLLFVWPTRSEPRGENLVREILDRMLDRNGQVVSITHRKEVIRPDGSRVVTEIKSFRDKKSPSEWQTHEQHRLYSAKDNVTFEIFPALRMYGSLPLGNQAFSALMPMSKCGHAVPKMATEVSVQETSKAGRAVEIRRFEVNPQGSPRTWAIEVELFPELGCLLGDKTTEVRLKDSGELVSRRTIRVLSVHSAPDDPSLFAGPPKSFVSAKPSELLEKHLVVMKEESSPRAVEAGLRADERQRTLWEERKAGKR